MEFPGQPVNFTYIGTVANILHGRKEDNQLKLDVVNEYILDADSIPNTFICHLWCHPDDEVGLHNYSQITFNVNLACRFLHQSILPPPLALPLSLREQPPLGRLMVLTLW